MTPVVSMHLFYNRPLFHCSSLPSLSFLFRSRDFVPSLPPFQSNKMTLSPLLTSPSEWLPNKSLVSAISPSPSHPHRLLISTSHSLLLLDLRQPRWPLLDQSHDLSHTPKVGETVFRDFSLLLATSLISVRAVIRLCLSSLSSPDIVHSSESFSLL